MKHLTTLLCGLLLSTFALAAPLDPQAIASMVAQSEYVMAEGLCVVTNDRTEYGSQTVLVVLPPPVGARRILLNDYNWLRGAGYEKGASGRYVMSERVEEACRADALGSKCLTARSYFRMNWTAP